MAETKELVARLSRQVTFQDDPPYAELETVLTELVTKLSAGEAPSDSVDWAAIVSEAVNLRPQHG